MTGGGLADAAARIAALTDYRRSLLVEAGAGSGKTALMAGRVALLIGAGTHPRDIAAITFTEAAAAELLERIERMVRELLDDGVPTPLREALPDGLNEAQKTRLQDGADALDEITCTTIHGFCQQLVRPYPVETGLDPGAAVIDPAAAELAYRDLMVAWLSARFGRDRGAEGLGRIPAMTGAGGEDDLFTELLLQSPDKALRLTADTAQFLKTHRTAGAATSQFDRADLERFAAAVDAFVSWYDGCGAAEPSTAGLLDELMPIAALARETAANPLTARGIALLLFHPKPSTCYRNTREFKRWGRKTKWAQAVRATGGSRARGEQLNCAGEAHYASCGDAYAGLCAAVGSLAFGRFVAEFDALRELYRDYKRTAALVDFDDLLHQARDLLRDDETVRAALAKRYPHILVDEFQDTDPVQAEIIWRLAGDGSPQAPWHEWVIRPGALFLVGDPKQAIYRFRGADVQTYLLAKQALSRRDPDSILEISANFRTREPILRYVNDHFDSLLSEACGQPGFTALAATRDAADEPSVAALDIALDDRHKNAAGNKLLANQVRREEAAAVAATVRRLIGTYPISDRTADGARRPARAGDIALLAPTGTSLWIYEQALEDCGIPIATQAGKGFFRRQEVQDLIAVARTLADSRDTLAFGALVRGPLVGLTEEQIADEIDALQTRTGSARRLNLWTDADSIANPVLRDTLRVLQNLARKARRTTPYHLLAEAVEELHVRAILKARHPRGAERGLANVELVLEMARAYAARGMGDFARALWQQWQDGDRQAEGRPDARADAVSIITMHSAKGLEWPIVIPINSATRPRIATNFLFRRRDNSVHFKMFDFPSPEFGAVREEENTEQHRERIRLWYVALTRARDLLLLPRQSERDNGDWFSLIDVPVAKLPALAMSPEAPVPAAGAAAHPNDQDAAAWEREAAVIAANRRRISWHRPSLHEGLQEPEEEPEYVFADADGLLEAGAAKSGGMRVRGTLDRGTILHKLMEEILTGETAGNPEPVQARAADLIAQLGLEDSPDAAAGPSSAELAAVAVGALQIPEIAALWPRLIPEFGVYANEIDGSEAVLVAGIADAVAVAETGRVEVVVDWKSDVDPGAAQRARYRAQVRDYLRATGARTGLIVYLTSGWVDRVAAA